ncbi:hypothetical protein MEO40_05960 [Dolichospermum sp. ST_sed1]|nr:hypothetical protein [Dolichospermum sp. ST_sed1]MDD1424521.1 hypothetical protein [Dolichospermum sp. ST_sed9]MDD1429633.1 hypothetical protein [Dolichospermum sp. ST_sed6]MDD1455503.1 hypothetical protein [Dolichospermum sp. ST_sed7]MDD1459585.1 hypothetical protein [Dolichospermum sp. ST_sed2]MDD1470046.1 hypothetical protein [Dolichospermum sp. ST_sed4]
MSKISNILTLISITLFLFIFFAFLPQPFSLGASLDPGWSYAISQAVEQKLLFGKDIVFTYGPLGYLVAGASLEGNFLQIILFRWLVYLLLFIVSIIRILTMKNSIHRLLLVLTILFALITGTPYVGVGMSTDYQILFIYLLILSFNNIFQKYPRLIPLFVGAVSGFCILTKFSLGIYIFGSFLLFLLINFLKGIKTKSETEIINNIFAITNLVLATLSVAWIFLIPNNFLTNFNSIILKLSFSCIAGISGWFLSNRVNQKYVQTYSNLLPWLIFYFVYSLLIAHAIFDDSSVSLINYFKNSLEMSSGYSSAMSVVGNQFTLVLAILEYIIILIFLFLILQEGYLNLSLSLLFILFICFKHGFVRQDGHVVVFAITIPLIALLCLLKIKKYRNLKISYFFYCFILIASIFIAGSGLSPVVQGRKLLLNNVIHNIVSISDLNGLKTEIIRKSKLDLVDLHLPNYVKKLVNKKTIDIIPWDISLVPANNLNWVPRPAFQSYSAYTNKLDNLNFESMSKSPRDYIFYNFQSIDGRHPFFDEPKTFFYVFCNYQPSVDAPDFINTPALKNIVLLEKRKLSRCLPDSFSKKSSISWNTPYSTETVGESIIRAKVKFQYSFIGKIYKTIFRSPPVMIKINYVNGFHNTYRIIPENSENGVIVNYLPKDDNEALSFLRGKLLAQVQSFSFQTSNSLLYAPKIELSFSSDTLRN